MAENDDAEYASERCDLLLKTKDTVDGLLANGSHVTWSTYGGLSRIADNIEHILMHHCRVIVGANGTKLGILELLNSLKSVSINQGGNSHGDDSRDIKQWIQISLLNHVLSGNLTKFVKSKTRLKHFYYRTAFLRSSQHFLALQRFLKAIEEDNPLLATTVSPILFNKKNFLEEYQNKCDDLSSSVSSDETSSNECYTGAAVVSSPEENEKSLKMTFTETDFLSVDEEDHDGFFIPKISEKTQEIKSNFSENLLVGAALTAAMAATREQTEQTWFEGETGQAKERDSHTDIMIANSPNVSADTSDHLSCNDTDILSEHERKKKIGHSRSKSDQVFRRYRPFGSTRGEKRESSESSTVMTRTDTYGSSLPTNSAEAEFYNGTLRSPSPRHKDKQGILGYLSSRDHDTCHDLEKENAHFSISEALICAIEQMKYETQNSDQKKDDVTDKTEEETLKTVATTSLPSSVTSDAGCSRELSKSVDSDYNSNEECATGELDDTRSVDCPRNNSRSASSFDGASTEMSCSPISAEQVALCLLEKVASRKNLKSADLKWMVSEKDVPQSLLPLPTAIPVSPDDPLSETSSSSSSALRGNLEWAPPRKQIIFNIPPSLKRKDAMQRQKYRCAGCGMPVDPGFMKRYRYCHYLGKYFCNTCSSSKPNVIPAQILHKWNFKEYDVSIFSKNLLASIHYDPLFHISAINKLLYKRVKELDEVKVLRLQLFHLVSYLQKCRYGEKTLSLMNVLESYIIDDIHLYSMNDLLEVKSGVLRERLKSLVKEAFDHVGSCQLCLAKGFICEYCRNGDDVIYPFEVKRCSKCLVCHACYHRQCFVQDKCPKCERLLLRKKAVEIFNIEDGENT